MNFELIKCLAIDDEPLALQQLAAYVRKIPFLDLVGECQSALEARRILDQEMVDAIFCDINMPDLNGMDFVKSLAAPPLVVFTTAYAEYAIEGYKVDAVDYSQAFRARRLQASRQQAAGPAAPHGPGLTTGSTLLHGIAPRGRAGRHACRPSAC